MHKFLPSAKLIAILRKPSSRAYSHFQHKCRQGRVFRVSPKSKTAVAGAVVTAGSVEKVAALLQKNHGQQLRVDEVRQGMRSRFLHTAAAGPALDPSVGTGNVEAARQPGTRLAPPPCQR